jgi:hypothetical protein
LGLAQVITVILGYFGLNIILRLGGIQSVRGEFWRAFALWLYHYGMALLMLPPVWVLLAETAKRREQYWIPYSAWMAIGILLPFILLTPFLCIVIHTWF